MIYIIIFILAILSVILSFISLKKELKKTKHEEMAEKDLARSKVLFYSPSDEFSSREEA